jgi:membrane associated rhomboid family serine protease
MNVTDEGLKPRARIKKDYCLRKGKTAMGIYNRDYYREIPRKGDWGLESLTPVVKYLILANVAVFLLQIFVVREVRQSPLETMRKYNPDLDRLLTKYKEGDPQAEKTLKKKYPGFDKLLSEEEMDFLPAQKVSIVQEWFELDTNKIIHGGQIWRLLTHAFCHDRYAIFHIIFNMLFLYWFGCTLETMYGSREFIFFYLAAAVVAALAFVGLDLYTGSSIPAVGASGAVLAVVMLYTMHFPREEICVCWIIPVQMRFVMLFYVIWDLHPVLLALAGDRVFSGIAHAAHLGGLAFGFLYAKFEWRLEPLGGWMSWSRWRWRRRPRLRLVPAALPEPESAPEQARVDQLLKKIFDTGRASLSDEERTFLQKASERIKDRANRER